MRSQVANFLAGAVDARWTCFPLMRSRILGHFAFSPCGKTNLACFVELGGVGALSLLRTVFSGLSVRGGPLLSRSPFRVCSPALFFSGCYLIPIVLLLREEHGALTTYILP